MSTGEVLSRPEKLPGIEFDDDATAEQRSAVEEFVSLATEADVEALVLGAELHDANPELVLKIVSYLGNYSVGNQVIRIWHKLYDAKPELSTVFDESTELYLRKDAEHKKLIDIVKSADSAIEVRAKAAVRRNRFMTFAKLLKAYKENEEAA